MNNKIPTEDEIENLLKKVQPQPNPEFHKRMAKKPWTSTPRIPFWSRRNFLKAAIPLAIIFAVGISLTVFSSSLNTMAQRLTMFFLPSQSNIEFETITALEPNHSRERFGLNINQIEDEVGFKIKIPREIPDEFRFEGVAYDELREAVILNYMTESRDLVMQVSMQKVDADFQWIGPEAEIEFVMIGTYYGEYVSGGWTIPEVESGIINNIYPPTIQTVWEKNVKLQTLRWSDGEFLYEIILAGGNDQNGYLDKEYMVSIAESIQ
ncbi:MAG: hypothetical protein ACK2U1_12455 [Anaerolineales bacterium]